jgi:hypothetical protein
MERRARVLSLLVALSGFTMVLLPNAFNAPSLCTLQVARNLQNSCMAMSGHWLFVGTLVVGSLLVVVGSLSFLQTLRAKARKPLRELYVQGSIAEFEHDGDDDDRYYLPGRSLAFRPNGAIHVLPDNERLRAYSEQLDAIYKELGLDIGGKGRRIFVRDSSYLLDVAVLENIAMLVEGLPEDASYRVVPYATTPPLHRWVDYLRKGGYDVTIAMPDKVYYEDLWHPSHRGGWARHVESPNRESFAERNGIPYPTAYVGQGLDQVLQAYDLVARRTRNQEVFFKPVFSAGGFTLRLVRSPQEVTQWFNYLKKQGALDILDGENPIEMQSVIQGIMAFYSIQYDGERIITPGQVTEQIIVGNNWRGNIFNSHVAPQLIKEAEEIFGRLCKGVRRYQHGMRLQGWGGVDLALVEESGRRRLVVIEHNGRRITGGHPAIALAEGFGIHGPFATEKTHGEPNCDLAMLWRTMKDEGLQFNTETRTGIFPLVFMPGSGMLLASGKTVAEARAMLAKANQVLHTRGYLRAAY